MAKMRCSLYILHKNILKSKVVTIFAKIGLKCMTFCDIIDIV